MDKERLIHLHHCEGISWKQIAKIHELDPDFEHIYTVPLKTMRNTFGFSEQIAERIYHHIHNVSFKRIVDRLKKYEIQAVTLFDKEYPERLQTIFDPPWVLYTKGEWETLSENKLLSVVGTRNPSASGVKALEKILIPLLQDKWTIVSGLAKGIDTYAHQLCLDQKAKTVAVLGSGLQSIYPKQNKDLAENIYKQGVVISEFTPFTSPKRWHFPIRNRIISGLSKATLVVEARKKSGSLITADQALEQGRDVFAIPGSILEACAEGTNHLIQNGAKLIMEAQDIVNEWN